MGNLLQQEIFNYTKLYWHLENQRNKDVKNFNIIEWLLTLLKCFFLLLTGTPISIAETNLQWSQKLRYWLLRQALEPYDLLVDKYIYSKDERKKDYTSIVDCAWSHMMKDIEEGIPNHYIFSQDCQKCINAPIHCKQPFTSPS
jgi:hypothetical protein